MASSTAVSGIDYGTTDRGDGKTVWIIVAAIVVVALVWIVSRGK
jgi:uncharacterized protein (DUF983 family)